jgi:hypothetical protein
MCVYWRLRQVGGNNVIKMSINVFTITRAVDWYHCHPATATLAATALYFAPISYIKYPPISVFFQKKRHF